MRLQRARAFLCQIRVAICCLMLTDDCCGKAIARDVASGKELIPTRQIACRDRTTIERHDIKNEHPLAYDSHQEPKTPTTAFKALCATKFSSNRLANYRCTHIPYLISERSNQRAWRATNAIRLLRWPAPSIVGHSRPSRGATGLAILLRGGRGPECRETDSLRAAATERSANPNRQAPSTRPEFEAGRST